MGKKLEYRIEEIKKDVKLTVALNEDLSEAIGKVLKEYGVKGEYLFTVWKSDDYCHEPVEVLKGRKLLMPVWSLGSGAADVGNPRYAKPI